MTSSLAPQPTAPTATEPLSHRQIVTVMLGLTLGMFLAALDQTIVVTAIRTIADDLHGLSAQAWATTAFLITSTISTPLYGKLSDIYGRKRFFVAAIAIFLIGSLACAFAQSIAELAAFRAVQGLGAGGLFTLAFAIVGDLVPVRERARYQGYFLAVFGTSSVLGPVIGGFLAGHEEILGTAGWRWVFLVNLPIGGVALLVVARVLRLPHTPRRQRVDWAAAATLTAGLVPLLIAAEQGQRWGWGSGRSLACLALGLAGVVAFIAVEWRAGPDALLPLRLFRDPVMRVTSLAGLIIGAGMFGAFALLPQYLQLVRGASATEAGLQLVPLVIGIMVASVASGQLTARTGRYKIFPVTGTALMIVSMLLMATIGVDTPYPVTAGYMVLFGLGLGGCLQTLILAAQNAVAPADIGVATASATFFRQVGGTLGTALFVSLMFTLVGTRIRDALTEATRSEAFQRALADPAVAADPANRPVLEALAEGGGGNLAGVLDDSSFLDALDPRLARPFQEGFAQAMDLAFVVGAAVLVLAFVLCLALREVPLRDSPPDDEAGRPGGRGRHAGTPPSSAHSVPTLGVPPAWPPDSSMPFPPLDPNLDPLPDTPREPDRQAPPAARPAAPTIDQQEAAMPSEPDEPTPPLNGVEPTELRHPAADPPPAPVPPPPAPPPPAGEVRGRVFGHGDAPLVGATLTLLDGAGTVTAHAVSGPRGEYRVAAAGPGDYLLVAAATGHEPVATYLTVGPDGAGADVRLRGAVRLVGRITDADGEPLPGASVSLVDGTGAVVAAARTGRDGAYAVDDLVGGVYTLAATGPARPAVAVRVDLPATGQAERDVSLLPGARVFGAARDERWRPLPGIRVALLDSRGVVVVETITNRDGAYAFRDLREGLYTVVATGYPPVSATLQVERGQQHEYDVALHY
ncbi:MFS transporter [Luedemannella helvata]|uniref:alpha-amylase n=1 Tax=Luedemannella helvata TaxID=349315 RepID=A0ABN2KIA2_9ACTN